MSQTKHQRQYKPVNILGVNVDLVTVDQIHTNISNSIKNAEHHTILNVNINCLNLAYENPWLKDFLNSASIVFCDGAGVILGASILGYQIPQRITYADWMWELAEFAEKMGYSLFLLGGKTGVAEKAAIKLKGRYPNLNIAGVHHGYFDKSPNSEENQAVVNKINQSSANILITSFGMPLQEAWLMDNWDNIHANIALTGGAALDYVSGELRRAPRWMTDHGLEWFGRFLIEPRRLGKRYFIGNPLFFWRIFLQKIGRKRV